MRNGVVNDAAALVQYLLQVAWTWGFANAQRVGCMPAGAHQHHLKTIFQPLRYSAQFGVHRGFGRVSHINNLMRPSWMRQVLHTCEIASCI